MEIHLRWMSVWSTRRRLRSKSHLCKILGENDDDAFVGYCSIEPGNTPEIGICLLPDYQGKGIGVNAIRLLWKKISMERELHYFVARVEECNVNSVKMFEKLGAKRMQTEESDVLKNLQELALVDKSLISVLVGMENFHNRIIQYAVAFDES